jgi:hypothetical protein
MKPAAPARSASSTYSSRLNVVTTRTRVFGSLVWSRRVASSPSTPGIRMSITTTSGPSWIACSTASAPSAASPTTRNHAHATAHEREVIRQHDPDHARGW